MARKTRLEFVVDEEEEKELKAAADKVGLSLGSFLRSAGLTAARKMTIRKPRSLHKAQQATDARN